MTYGLIDDHNDDDERWIGCPMEAIGLYWAVLPYALRRSENFIPSMHCVRTTYPAHQDPKPQPLVERGLWVEADGGYTYDPDDWSRMAFTDEKRQRKAEAGRVGGLASARTRRERYGTAQPRQSPERSFEAELKHSEAGSTKLEAVPVPVNVVTKVTTTPLPPTGGRGVAERVFAEWQGSTNHPLARLNPKRVALVVARLRDGYTEEDLVAAVLGVADDPWPERVLHNGFEVCLRDGAHVERFREMHLHPVVVAPKPVAENSVDARIRAFGARHLEVVT